MISFSLSFSFVIDWVRKIAYNSPTGICMQWTLTSRLETFDLVDEICTLSYRLKDSQHHSTAEPNGIHIIAQKKKSIRINSKQTDSIKISNAEVEDIKYLRSILVHQGHC